MMDWLIWSCEEVQVSEQRDGRRTRATNLGEESVEAVDLLPFLQEGVVLSDSAKSELVHEVDLVRLVHPLVLRIDPSRQLSPPFSHQMNAP